MPRSLLASLVFLMCISSAWAAPYRPAADDQVLERLPARATDSRVRELREMRQQLSRQPRDADLAVRLVRRYYEQVAAEGDPRYIGYGQAALAPWWDEAEPPAGVRVWRAVLRQFGHEFELATADLAAVVRLQPGNGEAWSWLAAIAMVQARYGDARVACAGMAPDAGPLIAAACIAAVDSVTGKSAQAQTSLRAALAQQGGAPVAQRLWALTRLAEIEERRGDYAAAEASFRRALALDVADGYLLAAYADFLLDRGRPEEVMTLLKDKERSDLLLLRLTLAAKAANAPMLARWSRDLGARFDAARLRGDTTHEKEEARYLLAVHGDAARAVALAAKNFGVQREPADARALLEMALAARTPAAAEPALRWMADSGIESVVLNSLAARLKRGP